MPMTPKQFRQALKRLGLTQIAAARHLRVDGRTVRRWIAGDRKIPGPVTVVISLWLKARQPRIAQRREGR